MRRAMTRRRRNHPAMSRSDRRAVAVTRLYSPVSRAGNRVSLDGDCRTCSRLPSYPQIGGREGGRETHESSYHVEGASSREESFEQGSAREVSSGKGNLGNLVSDRRILQRNPSVVSVTHPVTHTPPRVTVPRVDRARLCPAACCAASPAGHASLAATAGGFDVVRSTVTGTPRGDRAGVHAHRGDRGRLRGARARRRRLEPHPQRHHLPGPGRRGSPWGWSRTAGCPGTGSTRPAELTTLAGLFRLEPLARAAQLRMLDALREVFGEVDVVAVHPAPARPEPTAPGLDQLALGEGVP